MELFDLIIVSALRLVYFGVASLMTLFLFLYDTHMRTAGEVSVRYDWLHLFSYEQLGRPNAAF
jgi:hypothetical protein